jgi:hypothetical protein
VTFQGQPVRRLYASAQQFSQPAETFVQPEVGFQDFVS